MALLFRRSFLLRREDMRKREPAGPALPALQENTMRGVRPQARSSNEAVTSVRFRSIPAGQQNGYERRDGALGVGIELGVQDIFRDFIAGLVLLFDRSIEVGDFIELETGASGEIRSVGARATTLITNDNVAVLIPNSMLLRNRLTNWTRNRATRRIHVPFSVAFGSDKNKVRAAAIEAA